MPRSPSTTALILLLTLAGAACQNSAAETTGTEPPPQAPAAPQPPEPPKPMPTDLPDVLARVNGEELHRADLDLMVRNMELGSGPVPADRRDEVLRGALDRLITYTLLQQEARARNVTVTDAEVELRLTAMRGQFPDEGAFEKALAERSMTLDRLRADARADLVISKMMGRARSRRRSRRPTPTPASSTTGTPTSSSAARPSAPATS